ncbi:hypothetical protein E4U53_006384, partial [Claviceps sorghi]
DPPRRRRRRHGMGPRRPLPVRPGRAETRLHPFGTGQGGAVEVGAKGDGRGEDRQERQDL